MTGSRTITKSASRRLYDSTQRRYITLADVLDLVMQQIDFSVVDQRDSSDVTNRTLLQLLIEQEQSDKAVLSKELLLQMIRLHEELPQSPLAVCVAPSGTAQSAALQKPAAN
jgi:polyhydroxyalkanoate synthesis repressor PhaR